MYYLLYYSYSLGKYKLNFIKFRALISLLDNNHRLHFSFFLIRGIMSHSLTYAPNYYLAVAGFAYSSGDFPR